MPDWAVDPKAAYPVVYTNVEEWVRKTGRLPDYTSGTFSMGTFGVYCPVEIKQRMLVEAFFVANGASVNGNHQVGICRAREGGSLEPVPIGVVSVIAPQAGTSQWQKLLAQNPSVIPPGRYYLMYASSSTTGTVQRLYVSTANNCGENRLGNIHTGAPFPMGGGGATSSGTVTGGSVVPVLAVAGVGA